MITFSKSIDLTEIGVISIGLGRTGEHSYSHSQLTDEIQHIENPKEHHLKRTFKDEYLAFLKAFEIEFKNEYLFTWIDRE